MKLDYLAHINKEDKKEQLLKDHLKNTAELAGKFAESFHAYEWGCCCGMLHDIGKYSANFQRRVRGADIKVDHSTAGAQVCHEKKGPYAWISYCIAGHHAGLSDTGNSVDSPDAGTLRGRMKKKLLNDDDFHNYVQEIDVPIIHKPPFEPSKSEVKNSDFTLSMFIRMLYSCLVDADFLDTEWFMKSGQVYRNPGEPIEILYKKMADHVSDWLKNTDGTTVNGRRSEILRNCLERGEKDDRGLFRLTVPTGGGKTVASLAFALSHAKKHEMDRVIYVIPYTSIIEQNAKVFKDILGDDNVLEHHSNVEYRTSDGIDDQKELLEMQLATENWDKPVIVTTNVQFFESLFASKSSKCRKLHNIANSVIIFDEAQMLPNDYLLPCIAAMEQFLRHYCCTLVLCTATQPALQDMFGEDIKAKELCPRMEEQFAFFRRVTIKDAGVVSHDELIERLKREKQALCILNTKKKVQQVYRGLSGKRVFHLSTAMYPLHRKRKIQEIRDCIDNKEECIVIATSLVEAGVDLDFQTVYRQVAGIDSIIQAAGRCNREGKRDVEDSITYVFRLDEKEYVPQQRQQIAVAEILLEDDIDLLAPDTARKYFKGLYHFRGESLDKKRIMEEFRNGNFPFRTVGEKFKLIENETVTIFIPIENDAKNLLQEMEHKGYTKELMRRAGQYSVQIYTQDFDRMNGCGMFRIISEDIENFYVLRMFEKYSEETGLDLDIETGEVLFY